MLLIHACEGLHLVVSNTTYQSFQVVCTSVSRESNNPIATFKKKIFSSNKKWRVAKGDGSHSANLLFNANNTSPAASKIEMEVVLAGAMKQQSWDLKVVGSWLDRSCVVYNDHHKASAKNNATFPDEARVDVLNNMEHFDRVKLASEYSYCEY